MNIELLGVTCICNSLFINHRKNTLIR